MAGYKGHVTAGVIFGIALIAGLAFTPLAATLSLQEKLVKAVLILWLAVLFALFPDVDIKSKGQILFYRVFVLLDLALLIKKFYVEAALLGFLAMLPIISKHRGWTHSFIAMILVPSPILLGPMYLAEQPVLDGLPFYLGAVVGYLSHLVADGMVFKLKR
ncbi:MAG: metal-dependent hydrolase [Chlorobi bacterium]|nr:metal-dependent hydrolase [Chlorobiota bacterium]